MIRNIGRIWKLRGRGRIMAVLSYILRLRRKLTSRRFGDGIEIEMDLSDSSERTMYFGFYEVEFLKLLSRELQIGDTAIDVGANIGYISAHMALAVGPGGKIHSLEPSALVYPRLEKFAKHANEHGFTVETEKAALWDSPGKHG